MNIGLRLRTICDMCEISETIADIGCDHGLTIATLVIEKKTEQGIAADVSAPSLGKARELCEKLNITDKMQFLPGDGLTVLPEGYSGGAVISGMGAVTMCEILRSAPHVTKSVQYFVLSPNLQPELVRDALFELRFYIELETVVKEGKKFYPIMLAKRGKDSEYSPAEMVLGKHFKQFPTEYARFRADMLKRALLGDPKNETASALLRDLEKFMEENDVK